MPDTYKVGFIALAGMQGPCWPPLLTSSARPPSALPALWCSCCTAVFAVPEWSPTYKSSHFCVITHEVLCLESSPLTHISLVDTHVITWYPGHLPEKHPRPPKVVMIAPYILHCLHLRNCLHSRPTYFTVLLYFIHLSSSISIILTWIKLNKQTSVQERTSSDTFPCPSQALKQSLRARMFTYYPWKGSFFI